MEITISRVIGLKNFLNKMPNENKVSASVNESNNKSLDVKNMRDSSGKYFLYNQVSGARLSKEYDGIGPFKNGYAVVRNKALYGLINDKGEEVVAPKYLQLGSVNDGLCLIQKYIFPDKERYGYIDPNGNEVIKAKYIFANYFKEGRAIVELRKNKWAVINPDGYLVSKEYDSISSYEEGFAIVRIDKKDVKKYGVIDNNGHEIVEPCYDGIEPFENGYAVIKNGFYEGLINNRGEVVIQPNYTKIDLFEGKAIIQNFNAYGLITLDNNMPPSLTIIPKFKYDFLEFYDNQIGRFRRNNLWGLIDINGNEITFPKYDMISDLDGQLFQVKLNHKYGCIDRDGNEIIPPTYDDVAVQDGEYIIVKLNNKYGLATKDGKIIADPVYNKIAIDDSSISLVFPSSINPEKDGNGITVLKEEISYDIIIQSKNGRIERKFDTLQEQQDYYFLLKIEVDKENSIVKQRREELENELNLKEKEEFNSLRDKIKSI